MFIVRVIFLVLYNTQFMKLLEMVFNIGLGMETVPYFTGRPTFVAQILLFRWERPCSVFSYMLIEIWSLSVNMYNKNIAGGKVYEELVLSLNTNDTK